MNTAEKILSWVCRQPGFKITVYLGRYGDYEATVDPVSGDAHYIYSDFWITEALVGYKHR